MKKRLVSILLATVMVFSLGACGNSNENSGTQGTSDEQTETPTEEGSDGTEDSNETGDSDEAGNTGEASFTIGYPAVAATNTTMEAMRLNRTTVAEAAGGTLITEDWDFSPEGTVQAVEKLIERGCQGVIIVPTDESILPTITNICEEAGVYWAISMRRISDEAIKEIVYASDYYVGYVAQNGKQLGYDLGKAVADNGGKKYAIITGSVGDTDSDIRETGLAEAAAEFGLECVSEVRSLTSPADATAAVESILASYPDIDAIVRVFSGIAGDGVAIAEAISEAGKSGEVAYITFGTEDGMEEYVEDGTITQTFIMLNVIDSVIVSTILVNQINGTPMSDKKIEIELDFATITGMDELENYNKYYSTTEAPLYSMKEIQESMLGASLEDFYKNIIDPFSIQELIDRKNAQ